MFSRIAKIYLLLSKSKNAAQKAIRIPSRNNFLAFKIFVRIKFLTFTVAQIRVDPVVKTSDKVGSFDRKTLDLSPRLHDGVHSWF